MTWLDGLFPPGLVPWSTTLLALILSLSLGQVLALTYVRTYRGLSYSVGLVQGLVLGPVVTAMLMLAVGQSIAASIGLAGGLSIIRFRTTMRDPRDMMFVFAALGTGIVVGLRAWAVGVAGVGVFVLAVFAMSALEYGTRKQYDALVRFNTTKEASEAAGRALNEAVQRLALVTLREGGQGERMEHAYQVVLNDPSRPDAVAHALEAVDGVSNVAIYPQDPTVEA